MIAADTAHRNDEQPAEHRAPIARHHGEAGTEHRRDGHRGDCHVLLIRVDEIEDDERVGEVPVEGWVWQ